MSQVNIGASQNINEALKSQQSERPVESVDKSGDKAENFQRFVEQAPQAAVNKLTTIQTHAVERPYAQNEGGEKLETNPILGEESTSSQKSGSATDQEKKRQQQHGDDEVEGVAATGSKKGVGSKTGSLMDELSKLNTDSSKHASLGSKDIQAQTQDTINQIEGVKKQLVEAKSEIKPSYQALLNNRLTHVDDNLKIALSKAGIEHTPAPKGTGGGKGNSPVHRFLGFLTNTQQGLEKLQATIGELNSNGKRMTPADMLAIQIKVGFIQQQIELFTSLLNKALEATKTIMNVQV